MVKKILIDSDAYIEYLKMNKGVFDLVGNNEIHLCSIVVNEVKLGAFDKVEFNKINKAFTLFDILPLSTKIDTIFNQIINEYATSHRPSMPDALVAATAMHHDFWLLTCNIKDYKYIKGLKLINHDVKPLPRKKGGMFDL